MSDSNTIMGFIPKDQYVKYTYYLLLASSLGGLVLTLFGLLGIIIPLSPLFGLAGLCGLILALIGFFFFKEEFSALVPTLMFLVTFLVGAAQLIMIWTGYNSWSRGRSITKDNVKSEVQLALKRS